MRTLIFLLVIACSQTAYAQSVDDRRASLAGIVRVAFKENGVEKLGGGTLGSPFLVQVREPFIAAGGSVAALDGAAEAGTAVYELICSSMDWSDGSIRVACFSRLLRQVLLPTADGSPATKSIYAATWTSKQILASFPDYGAAQYGLDKVTVQLSDAFIAEWKAANPGLKPPAKAPAKKK